ncbi:hypothetical protein [Paenimyroides ceti]|uniref:hypothetical protein n=1 Tax=Paenimyroides ceti TaxID=395087 RepID=UPI0037C92C8C
MKEFVYIENDFLNVSALAGLVAFAGILGNCFGYWFGAKSGNYLYSKEDSFILRKNILLSPKLFSTDMEEEPLFLRVFFLS